jgi:hypothetical protein
MKIDAAFAFLEVVGRQKVGATGPSPTQNQGEIETIGKEPIDGNEQEHHVEISVLAMERSQTRQYIELLKRRGASLRLTARELRECQESFTSGDLEAMGEHVLYQKSLCSEIRALDDELGVLRRQMAVASGLQPDGMSLVAFEGLCDADSSLQLRQVRGDLEVVQERVGRLNRVYAGLLRRSRRSIDVLINMMADHIETCSPSPGGSARSFPW